MDDDKATVSTMEQDLANAQDQIAEEQHERAEAAQTMLNMEK